jgi:hypothetical protein
MQGLRKILRALAIMILPIIGSALLYDGLHSSDWLEIALGAFLFLGAFGLLATWFWQPW